MSETPNIPARPVLQGEAERNVTLREFEQRMQALSQQINDQIRAARELADAKAEALSQALKLQAEEYKRRLSELNHAHETAMENWRMSLPREMFESHSTEWQKWRDDLNTTLTTLGGVNPSIGALDARLQKTEDFIAKQQGKGAGIDSSWKVLVAIGSLILVVLSVGGVLVSVVLYVSRRPELPAAAPVQQAPGPTK